MYYIILYIFRYLWNVKICAGWVTTFDTFWQMEGSWLWLVLWNRRGYLMRGVIIIIIILLFFFFLVWKWSVPPTLTPLPRFWYWGGLGRDVRTGTSHTMKAWISITLQPGLSAVELSQFIFHSSDETRSRTLQFNVANWLDAYLKSKMLLNSLF